MPPPRVIKPFHILKNLLPRRRPGGEYRLLEAFYLESSEETLSHRIIPTITGATHAGGDPLGREHSTVGAAGVLTAPVGMMDQPGADRTIRQCHVQRPQCQH